MKIALCLSENAIEAQRIVSDMLEAQGHEPACISRLMPFPLGCLGLIGHPDEPDSEISVRYRTDRSFLIFAGLPIQDSGSGEKRQTVHPNDVLVRSAVAGDDGCEVIEQLCALDGAFVAVWWNAQSGKLTLVTDFLGMQPLYRADVNGDILFASEAKAFVAAGVLEAQPDAGAWGAMLYFGHQIGEQSLLAGVTRVPAATALTFDARREERARTTWKWPRSTGASNTQALRNEIGDAIRADVRAYADAYPDASILLSGGFDSRLILCLCHELGVHPNAIVQSHPDENADADGRFANAFASMLGIPVRSVRTGSDFFSSNAYLRFLERNEIATPSYKLFISTVADAVATERHGVWEGLLLDPALKFDYGEQGFAHYLEAGAGGRAIYRDAVGRVFAPAWAQRMSEEYDALLAAEQSRYSDDAEGVWRFSVLNRSRFRTGVNPYQIYDTVTPALTPGMSKHFWTVAASVDPRARFGKRLYRAVFEHLAPDGLRLPFASGNSLIPGNGGAALYHTQRTRALLQSVARRPKAARLLAAIGVPAPFAWAPSRFLNLALHEASLDDKRLNADWIRDRRATGIEGPTDAVALEVLMYWQAWHNAMHGSLTAGWGDSRPA